jgi:hypothetical protein
MSSSPDGQNKNALKLPKAWLFSFAGAWRGEASCEDGSHRQIKKKIHSAPFATLR